MTKSEQYARDVISGKELACLRIRQQAERFLADFERDDLIWDVKEIERLNKFAEGVVYIPETRTPNWVQPPHAFWLEQLYGWKYKDGSRRYRDVYIQVARKNYKTFYVAIVSLFEMLLGEDVYPEILHGANDREQALICTRKTGEIIKKSPLLKKMLGKTLWIFTQNKEPARIYFENKNKRGTLNAMPKNPGDGGNPSIGIVDEFHEAKDTLLLETIKSGQGQRKNPLTLVITSPGYDKTLPCYTELRATAIKILDGVLENDRFLPIIFELDKEEEWNDINMLHKSNPMLPYAPTLRPYLQQRLIEARVGGDKASKIKVKNCGVWVDSADIWIPMEVIRENNHGIEIEEGSPCIVGVDLSAGTDLNSASFLFNKDGKMVVKTMFWIPESKIGTDSVDYRKWVEEGYLRVFDGNTVNYKKIADDLVEEMDKYDVKKIGIDPKYASSLFSFLEDTEYVTNLDLIEKVGQGYPLSGALNDVEQLIHLRGFDFGNNPVLNYNFACVTLVTGDRGDRMISKKKSTGRIDGVSSLITGYKMVLDYGFKENEIFIDVW